ncbi:hypothetical protein EJB05_42701 [Eragrostis curvula]|uniref:Protein kinase domain-containing protein n=1 Tax=Eragrostis curvula TaxID=38414 RepID=A0A5J9TDF8_9POAL|nr:hypothetical protein EJB05_42701 [Eragrostis curvula]
MVVAGAGLRRVLGALWFLATLLLRLGVAGNAAVASVDGRRGGDDGRGLGVRDIGLVAAGEMQLRRLHLGRRIPPQPAFSPLTLRLGGSLQDKVVYGTADLRRPCTPAKVVFGLNALNGRVLLPDGSLGGPLDYTNAASLIRYTVNKGYEIHGWELGNELSGKGGARVGADQYSADVIGLKSIVDKIYKGNPSKPLVLAPGGFFDTAWFTKLIAETKQNQLNVITHHIYNLGAAGGADKGGRHLVTDSFVFNFWFLDQLGMSAKYDTKTYCRQSLIGGNYGLLNRTTFQPNPDYYSALLWHRLMGTKVPATTFRGTNKIRAYAHCAKDSTGITLLLINLSGKTTTQVSVTSEAAAAAHKQGLKKHTRETRHVHDPAFAEAAGAMRNEYHLTPKDGNLQSQVMLLNGKALATDADGNIPRFEAAKVDAAQPTTVAPYSIVFSHIPHFSAPALLVSAPAVPVVGQPGFISIDCGLDARYGSQNDRYSGIDYVPDGPYVDSGENHELSSTYGSQQPNRFLTLRSFPSGKRNCYTLPTVADAKYLVRMEIFYGNYDGRNSSPGTVEFDLYLGPNFWDTVYVDLGTAHEAIFIAWASWVPVCLVNTGRGTPFVSALDLRPLGPALYPSVTPGLTMTTYNRLNMGGSTSFTRYPDDPFDRFWWWMVDSRWTNRSNRSAIQPDPKFVEPLPVLQTAVEASGNDMVLTPVTWNDTRATLSFIVFLHFADFQNLQLRQFDRYFNSQKLQESPYIPSFLVASCIYSSTAVTANDRTYNITLVATAKSVLPPMVNAIEVYTLHPHKSPTTFSKDFDAIMAIKFEYGVKKNWMGDPCFPDYWYGVKCSNTSGNTTRITSLDLSNSNLSGVVSTNFTLLTALENLNLSGNHLSGNSLCKRNTGSLILRYDSDENMCNQTLKSSRKREVVLITPVVVSVLVMAALFLAYFIRRAKRKPTVYVDDHAQIENVTRSRKKQEDHLQDTENRRFTYKDLEKFTDNFKRFIGKGGFGLVYHGYFDDGTEVAVKMRSESSSHGLDEFLAEVQSLTKVHHRNIVSLVGYCWEKDHLGLVYEYMSQGNLTDHLRGKNGVAETLTWGTRLRVVLEAAQGLDYLHKGCSPPIIHRDIWDLAELISAMLRLTYQPLLLAHLASWTRNSVADRRLGGAYDVNSMWKVVDTALMCTADAGAARPTMSDVVAQLKDSLALEEARESECSIPASAASASTALISTFGPMAR